MTTATEQPVAEANANTDSTPATPTPATPATTRDAILDKEPTALHRRYALYITETTGFKPEGAEPPSDYTEKGNARHEEFVKAVQIAVVRYGTFQKSPENAKLKVLEAQRKEQADAEAKQAKAKLAAEKAEAAAKALAEKEAAKPAATAATDADADAPKTKKAAPTKAKSGAEAPF